MKYRIFAVLLALLMIAGMLPSAAFAAEGDPEIIPEEEEFLLPDPEPEAEPVPDEEYIIPDVIEEEPAPLPEEEEPEDPQPEPSPEQGDDPAPAPDPEPEREEDPLPSPDEEADPPDIFEETDGEDEDLPLEDLPVLDYVDTNGNVRQLAEYVLLTGESACLEDGFFYVSDGVLSLPEGLTVNGTASLLLTDDALLTVSHITLTEGNTLLIYGQQAHSGVLSVTGSQADAAAIGCGAGENCGTLVICGGCIDACGRDGFPAIGGGEGSLCGAVTVFGGTVSAIGGVGSAGLDAGLLPEGGLSLNLGEGMLLYASPNDSTALTACTPEAYCASNAHTMQIVVLFSAADDSAAQAFGVDLSAQAPEVIAPVDAAPTEGEDASLSVSITSNMAEEVTSAGASGIIDGSDDPDDPDDPEEEDAPAGELSAGADAEDADAADADAADADAEDEEAVVAAAGMPVAVTAMLFNNTLGDPQEPTPVTPPAAPSWTAPEEDGEPHTYPLQLPDDSPLEIVGGEEVLTQTASGKYTVEVKIKDDEKTNYEWADGVETNADGNVEYTFVIKFLPQVAHSREGGNFGGIGLSFANEAAEKAFLKAQLTAADEAAREEGCPVYFWLEAKQSAPAGEAKTKCDAAVNSLGRGVKAPLWLDIRLKKTVQRNDPAHPDVVEDVQPVSGSVHIRADVSSANLIDSSRNRTFYRVHYHDGDASASTHSQGLTDGRFFEFDTSSFSTFGFPYYDVSTVTAIVSSPSRAVIESEAVRSMREGDEYTFTAKVNMTGYYFGRVKVDGELVTEFPGVGTGRASYTFINSTPLKEHTIEFVMYDSNGAPATGDDSAPALWAAAAAGAALGLCCLLRRKRSA